MSAEKLSSGFCVVNCKTLHSKQICDFENFMFVLNCVNEMSKWALKLCQILSYHRTVKVSSTEFSLVSSFDIYISLSFIRFSENLTCFYYLYDKLKINKKLLITPNVIGGFWTKNWYMVKQLFASIFFLLPLLSYYSSNHSNGMFHIWILYIFSILFCFLY